MLRRRLSGKALVAVVMGVLVSGSAWAQSNGTTVEMTEPLPASTVNPCNGEAVFMQGARTLTLAHDNQNGAVHLVGKLMTFGTGVGSPNGNKYAVNESAQFDIVIQGAFVATEETNEHVTSQGNDPNFMLHSVVHITVNANGETTAVIDPSPPTCK